MTRLLPLALAVVLCAPSEAQFGWTSAVGRVWDAETGDLLEGAHVTVAVCDALNRPETCVPDRGPGVRTDSLGAFLLGSTRATYPAVAVRVAHEGYATVQMPPYQDFRALQTYEIALAPRGRPLPADLPAPGFGASRVWIAAVGVVRDIVTGRPVEGARVSLLSCLDLDRPTTCAPRRRHLDGRESPHPNDQQRTDAQGRFELRGNRYGNVGLAVLIEHPGYDPVQLSPFSNAQHVLQHYHIALFPSD